MMRQLVGAPIELRHSSAAASSNTTAIASGRLATCAANSTGKVAGETARAVSFHPSRMLSRSSAARMSSLPIARSGCATAASSSRTSRPASASTLARDQTGRSRIRSPPLSPPACRPRARRSLTLTDRSNLAVARRRPAQTAHASPGSSKRAARIVLERQHHLEQRMARQRSRRVEHLHQPLERQLLMAVGQQDCRRAPAQSARAKLGSPDVSVRSTSVLTKNPTRSSSALSVRPAIGLPIAMSLPAPSRVSSAAKSSLQHHEQARSACRAQAATSPAMQLGPTAASPTLPPRWLAHRRPRPVARQLDLHREALQRARASTPAGARSRSRHRSRCPAPHAATACSRHIAPASGASPGARPRQRAA